MKKPTLRAPNKGKPLISVLMPAFNVAPFIAEAIESVLSQNFPSCELLIVDDASTDTTYKIIRKYAHHPQIRCFRNLTNQGQAWSRNRLLSHAWGSYITPCDADDLLLPGNLSRLSSVLENDPAVGLAYGDSIMTHTSKENGRLPSFRLVGEQTLTACDLFGFVANHGGSMMRKKLLLRVGGYDPTLQAADDYDLHLRLRAITTFKYLRGELLYYWRRRKSGTTSRNTMFGIQTMGLLKHYSCGVMR